jgi:ABC-type nitrate/sulfonate/bicarbonate transport system permease component
MAHQEGLMMSSKAINRCIGILAALGAWEIGGRMVGDALFAPASAVIAELASMLRDGQMPGELVASLRQMLVGFAMACAIGMPVGVAMGRSRVVDALVHPWLSMFIVTSVAALVPLFILLFGTGFWFRVAVVFTASVWYILLTTYQGARGLDPRWVEVGLAFSAGPLKRFFSILLPALYPYLITAARIGLVHAIRAMVIAEMFIIVGYGGLIYSAGLAISTAPLLALLFMLMIVGVAANAILGRLGRRLVPWFEDRHGALAER